MWFLVSSGLICFAIYTCFQISSYYDSFSSHRHTRSSRGHQFASLKERFIVSDSPTPITWPQNISPEKGAGGNMKSNGPSSGAPRLVSDDGPRGPFEASSQRAKDVEEVQIIPQTPHRNPTHDLDPPLATSTGRRHPDASKVHPYIRGRNLRCRSVYQLSRPPHHPARVL